MRKMNTSDVFAALRVVKKLNLQKEFKKIALEAEKSGNTDVSKVGADVLAVVLDKMSNESAEKEIYGFLARPLEMAPDEVGKMDLLEISKQLKEIADFEGWRTFLSRAASLI